MGCTPPPPPMLPAKDRHGRVDLKNPAHKAAYDYYIAETELDSWLGNVRSALPLTDLWFCYGKISTIARPTGGQNPQCVGPVFVPGPTEVIK